MDKVLVKNAADEKQVKRAAEKDKFGYERSLNDVRAILAIKEGRRFIWELMAHCKVFETVWDNSARIHYNSGKQDVGHYVLARINDAEPEALIKMMLENKGD